MSRIRWSHPAATTTPSPSAAQSSWCKASPLSQVSSFVLLPCCKSPITSHRSRITAFRFATHVKTGFTLTPTKQTIALIPVRNKIEGVPAVLRTPFLREISIKIRRPSSAPRPLGRNRACRALLAYGPGTMSDAGQWDGRAFRFSSIDTGPSTGFTSTLNPSTSTRGWSP